MAYLQTLSSGAGAASNGTTVSSHNHLLQSGAAKTQKYHDSGEGQNTYFPAATYVFGTPIGIRILWGGGGGEIYASNLTPLGPLLGGLDPRNGPRSPKIGQNWLATPNTAFGNHPTYGYIG